MRKLALVISWMLTLWMTTACGARNGLPAGADLSAPRLEAWEKRDPKARLWPEGTRSAQVFVAPYGRGMFTAYGIADGKRVVWSYVLSTQDLVSFYQTLLERDLPTTDSTVDTLLGWYSFGLAGTIVGPGHPDPPPGPIGDELRANLVRALLIADERIRADIDALGRALGR